MNLLEGPVSTDLALIDAGNDRRLSYGELVAHADELAASIGERKSLLFVLAQNDLFTATVYAAALRGHHALAFLDGSRPLSEHLDLMATYGPAWLAGPAGTADALADLGVSAGPSTEVLGGELVSLGPRADAPLHPGLAVLLSTSGTTGNRRYVRLSRDNIEANAASIAQALELDASERPITSLPLHYSFGLSVLHSHWAVGASVVLTDDSVLEAPFWGAIHDHHCTSLAGVPFTYQMMERVGFREMDLPSLLTLQQAGGALDVRLTREYAGHMAAKGGRLVVMYGQTEATARMAYVPPDVLARKIGSAGIAVPQGRFRIEPAAGGQGQHGAGEIVYVGPNVMLGYAVEAGDLTAGDELAGTLYTGDIGYLDDDGYLFIIGRSKRIAKVHGVRLSLDELELMLRDEGPAAVIARPNLIVGFCAFGDDATLEVLAREVARRARLNPQAVRLARIDEIPQSASGKPDYGRLERRWQAEGRCR